MTKMMMNPIFSKILWRIQNLNKSCWGIRWGSKKNWMCYKNHWALRRWRIRNISAPWMLSKKTKGVTRRGRWIKMEIIKVITTTRKEKVIRKIIFLEDLRKGIRWSYLVSKGKVGNGREDNMNSQGRIWWEKEGILAKIMLKICEKNMTNNRSFFSLGKSDWEMKTPIAVRIWAV